MQGRNQMLRDEITRQGVILSIAKEGMWKNRIFAESKFGRMINDKIPKYYVTKDNITIYLVFLFFYSLLFVNIFTPFQGAWYNIQHYTRAQLFTDTLVIVSGGILIMLISRLVMYNVHKRNHLSYLQYFSWLLLEVLLIAFLYAVIVHFAVRDTRDFSDIFTRAVIFVPTILVIPAIISHLYFSSRYKDEKISELESSQNQTITTTSPSAAEEMSFTNEFVGEEFILDNHVTASTNPEPTEKQPIEEPNNDMAVEPPVSNNKIVNFFDEKGELQLSLRIDNIYYIESAENYVNIYYKNKEKTERFTLRSSLKKQQEKLEKYGFIRCHRSYLVNFSNILLLRKDKDGPYLDFGESGLQAIPVSKTYLDAVTAYFISSEE